MLSRGKSTRNFISDFNKLLICREFGYTEDEYDNNSVEFNIKASYLLDSEYRASKVSKIPNKSFKRR
jgi:hypothetical protein